jgi:AcrR family transcriptional regulator
MSDTPSPRKRRPRGPGRLTAEDAARLPDRLLDAAQAVFIEQGYARATMDAIARAAGASRKTIYARYAGKAEVLAAVFERLLKEAMPTDPHPIAVPPSGTESARAELLRLGRGLATTVMTPVAAGLNRLIAAESHQFPEVARLAAQLQGLAIDGVRRVLERLRDEGHLPGLTDPARSARIFVEMTVGVQRGNAVLGLPMARRESDSMVQIAVDLFLDGCRTPIR